jgi:hypothetical protein
LRGAPGTRKEDDMKVQTNVKAGVRKPILELAE